jgi:hypothetical protein
MATDNTYILTLKDAGDKTFIMPAGFESNVTIHCWGAGGGGTIGASGGGGGYASTLAQIPAGAVVRLQIGQPGTNGDRRTGGLGGTYPSYTRYRGGSAGSAYDEDWDTGAGGGGGGASAVVINNSPVCVGAGGGGAGGLGDDSPGGTPGNPGGVYPGVATDIYPVTLSYAWCQFMNDYAVWGPFSPFTTTINFPTTGVYTFAFAVDNFGNVQVDGVQVVASSNFNSVTYGNVTINSGNRTVRVFATNTGGPAGVAVRILKPDLSELTNSRNYTVSNGLTATSDGGVSVDAWTSGGGGGGGYYGGQGGISYGDDAGNAPGGNGGQNYGNITIAGSGTSPGGTTSIYYPTTPPNIGRAGSPGYIVMIFTRAAGLQIKGADGSGNWVPIEESYVKLPEFSYTIYLTPPSSSTFTYGTNDFVIPIGVTEISVTATGGGGGGGGGGYGTGGESSGSGGGGGSGFTTTVSNIAVTALETLTVVVGAGGAAGASHYSRSAIGNGGNGAASTISRGASILLTAAGGNGGTGGRESQTVAGGTGFNNGSNGQPANSGTATAGGNGGDSFFTAGARGVASTGGGGGYVGITSAPSGSLGSGGAGGGASNGSGPGAGADQAANGGKGGDGRITINYSSPPIPLVITTGGWKTIESIYYKDSNNVWQPISQSGNITLYNYT